MQYAYICARIVRVQTETKAMDGQKSNPCIQEYDSSLSFPRPHCLLLIGTSTSAWYLSLSHENECLVCGQYRIIGGDRHFHTPRKFCVATIYDCRCYTTTFLSCLFSGGGGGGAIVTTHVFEIVHQHRIVVLCAVLAITVDRSRPLKLYSCEWRNSFGASGRFVRRDSNHYVRLCCLYRLLRSIDKAAYVSSAAVSPQHRAIVSDP